MNIHPSAVVSSAAQVAQDAQIGPLCVVESGAVIGAECVLESHVVVKEGTTLGPKNHVFDGAVLGGLPQHVHAPANPGRVIIGAGNTIRECVTVHRALVNDHATVIGDNCLLMVGSHVAHDCHVGNNVILTNNALLAGHVTVGDRAYISGAAAVHQFCRIGTLAMVGGQSHLSQDVPPYVTVDGMSTMVVGLNKIGLRRAGYDQAAIQELMAAYRVIYRSGLRWVDILEQLRTRFPTGPAALFYEFLSTTARGVISERRAPPGATIKLRDTVEAEPEPQVRVKFA
ncbi:MAG: acyl-ACP--UDP-N-acetylglucosamine O-acyltransferase [Planctomycetaceae bacterium]|nr:acyl-ACP--UDP-N-acetylglucosamine O-acyltransferase [Planctomycetaceae bacterium]